MLAFGGLTAVSANAAPEQTEEPVLTAVTEEFTEDTLPEETDPAEETETTEVEEVRSYEAAGIKTLDIAECDITVQNGGFMYSGLPKTPTVSVMNGRTLLKEGGSYTLSYSNNVNAGKGKVTITGIDFMHGSITKEFTIMPNRIESFKMILPADSYEYKNKAVVPVPTVKNNKGNILKRGRDYLLRYSNNAKPGTATVTAIGTGNYAGGLSKKFSIVKNVPADVSGITATDGTDSTIALKWNKVNDADGYIIYIYDDNAKTWKRYKKTTDTKTSFTVSGLDAGTVYGFTVKAYKTVDSKEYTSEKYTRINAATAPAKPSFTISTKSKGKAVLNWKTVKGATSYAIYYKPKGGSWKKLDVVNNKTTSYTYSKVKSGDTGYLTVRAFKNYKGVIRGGKYDTKAIYKYPTAAAKLDKVGWNLRKAFDAAVVPWSNPNKSIPKSGSVSMQWYADYGFSHGYGHCFCMAAMFAEMAQTMGYNATQVHGYVGTHPHSWVLLKKDSKTYICDPDFNAERKGDGYCITYGQSKTWPYSNYGNGSGKVAVD